MRRIVFRRYGDTLVEVSLAVGIFALVAISVVMVVNMSTSGAQSSLENTLAREEIDSQTEALRFLQSAYINDESAIDKKEEDDARFEVYKAIWDEVASYAKKNMVEVNKQLVVNYSFEYDFHPSTCESIYDGNPNYLQQQNAFIIDIKKINEYNGGDVKAFAKEVVLPASAEVDNKKLFSEAVSYPHLVYEKANSLEEEPGNGLINEDSYNILRGVEGMFIVGIQDSNTTSIVTEPSKVDNVSAYYDFYARGCWYNTGSETPSVVSTKIRLRNPGVKVDVEPENQD